MTNVFDWFYVAVAGVVSIYIMIMRLLPYSIYESFQLLYCTNDIIINSIINSRAFSSLNRNNIVYNIRLNVIFPHISPSFTGTRASAISNDPSTEVKTRCCNKT